MLLWKISKHLSFNNPCMETWAILLLQPFQLTKSPSSQTMKAFTATIAARSLVEIHQVNYSEFQQFLRIQVLVTNLPLMLKSSRSIKRGLGSSMNNPKQSKSKRWAAPFSEKRTIHLKLSLINPSSSDSEFIGYNKTYESLFKTHWTLIACSSHHDSWIFVCASNASNLVLSCKFL